MIPVFRPNLGQEEEDAVSRVLASGWIGNGPVTRKFENDFSAFTHAKFSLAVNSASAAIHLALFAGGVGEGDEVITPSLTFVATNHPILMQRATPVFCDVEEDTLCIDPEDIARKITKKTRAIIVVHYGGHPADLLRITKLCKEKNILLIEDCAHGMGSFYNKRHVGTFGDFGCFSFAAIKNLTTGDGGMLVGKQKRKIDQARTLAWSGISQSTWERSRSSKMKWRYNVASIGWKYQMNDIAAAIGLVQLSKLNANNAKRRNITSIYNRELSTIPWITTPVIRKNAVSSHHNYVIRVPAKLRDKLSDYLASLGIATSVHYVPSHHYKMYSGFRANVPVTEKAWKEILLLPIFPDLAPREQDFIISNIKKFKP